MGTETNQHDQQSYYVCDSAPYSPDGNLLRTTRVKKRLRVCEFFNEAPASALPKSVAMATNDAVCNQPSSHAEGNCYKVGIQQATRPPNVFCTMLGFESCSGRRIYRYK